MGIEALIQLLLYLLIGGLIIYVVYWILGMLAIPQIAKQISLAILAVIVIYWLLRTFGLV